MEDKSAFPHMWPSLTEHKQHGAAATNLTILQFGLKWPVGTVAWLQCRQEMNSARRHAMRWHHLLESLSLPPLQAGHSDAFGWTHWALSSVSICYKFLETNPLKHAESRNPSLKTETETGQKPLNCSLNGKTTRPDTGCLASALWGAPDLAADHVYVHSQSRCYSGLSVPSGPSTRGEAGGKMGSWHFYIGKLMCSGYWALKTCDRVWPWPQEYKHNLWLPEDHTQLEHSELQKWELLVPQFKHTHTLEQIRV